MLLILTPIYLSALVNAMLDRIPATDLLLKESVALTLALLVLWPADWVMQREVFGEVLAAACAAILVHAMIGLYQVYSFSHDEFPLLFLYRNPSFKSMEEWAPIYARYMKRPCGLFPEPSAMAASLGPWLVLLAGLLLDPRRGACRSDGGAGSLPPSRSEAGSCWSPCPDPARPSRSWGRCWPCASGRCRVGSARSVLKEAPDGGPGAADRRLRGGIRRLQAEPRLSGTGSTPPGASGGCRSRRG